MASSPKGKEPANGEKTAQEFPATLRTYGKDDEKEKTKRASNAATAPPAFSATAAQHSPNAKNDSPNTSAKASPSTES
ncbi:hypothetical protein ACUY3D_02780 [Corynebacterium guaraldiae]